MPEGGGGGTERHKHPWVGAPLAFSSHATHQEHARKGEEKAWSLPLPRQASSSHMWSQKSLSCQRESFRNEYTAASIPPPLPAGGFAGNRPGVDAFSIYGRGEG